MSDRLTLGTTIAYLTGNLSDIFTLYNHDNERRGVLIVRVFIENGATVFIYYSYSLLNTRKILFYILIAELFTFSLQGQKIQEIAGWPRFIQKPVANHRIRIPSSCHSVHLLARRYFRRLRSYTGKLDLYPAGVCLHYQVNHFPRCPQNPRLASSCFH